MFKKIAVAVIAVAVIAIAAQAEAFRPMVTDDASVVPAYALGVEPSFRYNENLVRQDNVARFGITNWLQASAGFSWGRSILDNVKNHWGVFLPMLELKAVIMEPITDGVPGFAVVVGSYLPYGTDELRTNIWQQWAYVAATEKLFQDSLIVSVNFGAMMKEPKAGNVDVHAVETWGVGAQYKIYGGLNVLGEIFSGNRMTGFEGGAWQGGLRYVFNDKVAIDAFVGKGIWGRNGMTKEPLWVGAGLTVTTASLW